jgi:hypothetical protein
MLSDVLIGRAGCELAVDLVADMYGDASAAAYRRARRGAPWLGLPSVFVVRVRCGGWPR